MAPSSTRMRVARRSSRRRRLSVILFESGGNQYGERVARLAGADADGDVRQAGFGQHLLQLAIVEAEAAVAEFRAHPVFLVRAEIQHEDTSTRYGDPCGLGDRFRGLLRVMQRLREQRDVDL